MKLLDSLGAIIRDALFEAEYFGFYEYSVYAQAGETVSARPVDSTLGMPDVTGVKMWPPVGGTKCTVAPGSVVLMGFRDGSPTKPFIAFVSPDATVLFATIGDGVLPIARAGDLAGGIWPIVPTQVKALT